MKRRDFLKTPLAALVPKVETPKDKPVWILVLRKREVNNNWALRPGAWIDTTSYAVSYREDMSDINLENIEILEKSRWRTASEVMRDG